MNVKQKLAALRKPAKKSTPTKKLPAMDTSKTPVKIETINRAKPHKVVMQTKVLHGSLGGGKTAAMNAEAAKAAAAGAKTVIVRSNPHNDKEHEAIFGAPINPETIAHPIVKLAPTFENAAKLVMERGIAATSILMEGLDLDYKGAAHMMDALEKEKVIAGGEGLMFHGAGYRRVYNIQEVLR